MRRPLTNIMQSLLVTLLVTVSGMLVGDESNDVPLALNLQNDAQLAQSQKLPLLLMFSADECPYCVTVEEEFLKPMIISGQYTHKVMMRKLMMNSHPVALSFNGKTLDVSELARKYDIFATPTVVFVDDRGTEIAERLVGINTVDYYGAYLDKSIDFAREKMQQSGRP